MKSELSLLSNLKKWYIKDRNGILIEIKIKTGLCRIPSLKSFEVYFINFFSNSSWTLTINRFVLLFTGEGLIFGLIRPQCLDYIFSTFIFSTNFDSLRSLSRLKYLGSDTLKGPHCQKIFYPNKNLLAHRKFKLFQWKQRPLLSKWSSKYHKSYLKQVSLFRKKHFWKSKSTFCFSARDVFNRNQGKIRTNDEKEPMKVF